MAPLIVFPEGTTSSGHHLLSFKKGAFQALVPLQPYVIYYESNFYNPSFDVTPYIVHLPLLLSQPSNNLHVCRLPVIHPPPPPKETGDGETGDSGDGGDGGDGDSSDEERNARVTEFMETVRKAYLDFK
eukprot:Platyproteum_vivax@DN9207_c0_g1_i1.p2